MIKKKLHAIGFHDLLVSSKGPLSKPGSHGTGNSRTAAFSLTADVSSFFPFINAVALKSELYEKPPRMCFNFSKTACVLYPEWCLITPVKNLNDARQKTFELIAYLNGIVQKKDLIVPNYKKFKQKSVMEILRLLPLTNCTDCGFKTCMAFAAMLSKQQTNPGRCPYMVLPVEETAVYPIFDSRGNKVSKITLNVDMIGTGARLKQQEQYIQKLEASVVELSENNQQSQIAANESLPSPLTKREVQVLKYMATGATNAELAIHLDISTHTVKTHVIHIFNKLGVNDRTQAAVWAACHNFL